MTDQPDWFAPATSDQLTQLIANTQPIAGDPDSFTVVVGVNLTQLSAPSNDSVVILYNPDTTNQVFVGGSNLTAANGTPIPPGGYHTWVIKANNILYGRVVAGTITVRVTEASIT